MMTSLRDDLIDTLRIARLGRALPNVSVWREHAGLEADQIMRLLSARGVELVRTGAPIPEKRPDSPIIWRSKLVGREAERLIRAAGKWQIVNVEAGAETVELDFTLDQAFDDVGLVLTDAPEARKIAGLGRKLAAALWVYRMSAEGMA